MLIPYGGLVIADGGAVTQALTTSPGAVVAWNGTKGANSAADSNARDGDPTIIPDKTNSRIKVLPGIYFVQFDISLTADAAKDLVAQLRVNGTAKADLTGRSNGGTARTQITFSGIVEVKTTDVPGTLGTFADPSATGFAGAGGAPKSLSTIDVTLATLASTCTATLEAAHLSLTRLA